MTEMNTGMYTFKLECTCGEFQSSLSIRRDESLVRILCYCEDCQRYARYLGTDDRSLDEHGGTDIVQISPAAFDITSGRDRLGCICVKPNGIHRWYTTCCNSPICSSVPKRDFPYVAPPTFGINAGQQHPINASWPVYKGFGVRGIYATMRNIFRWKFRGHGKLNPFLNEADEPIVEPAIIASAG